VITENAGGFRRRFFVRACQDIRMWPVSWVQLVGWCWWRCAGAKRDAPQIEHGFAIWCQGSSCAVESTEPRIHRTSGFIPLRHRRGSWWRWFVAKRALWQFLCGLLQGLACPDGVAAHVEIRPLDVLQSSRAEYSLDLDSLIHRAHSDNPE